MLLLSTSKYWYPLVSKPDDSNIGLWLAHVGLLNQTVDLDENSFRNSETSLRAPVPPGVFRPIGKVFFSSKIF